MSQHTIEKLVRGETVRRTTRDYVLKVIQVYKSKMNVKAQMGRARPHHKTQEMLSAIGQESR
jgi:hypothetical protein